MNSESFTETFNKLFAGLDTYDSQVALFFLIITFLLGVLFTWIARGGRIRRLKKELSKKEEAHKLLNAEMVGLKEQFELKEADLKKAQLTADDLQLNLSARKEAQERSAHQVLAQKNQLAELTQDATAKKAMIEDLNHQIVGLKAQNSQMETELEQRLSPQQDEAAIELAKSNYDETLNRLAALEQKLNLLETENTGLKSELSAIHQQSDSAALSGDFEEVKALLRKLSSENAGLKSEIHSIKDDTQTKVIRKAEEEMQRVQERLALLESENQKLQLKIQDLNQAGPIEFVAEPVAAEEPIEEEESREERSARARKALQAAIGERIKLATEAEKDDLKHINGVGPFIEEKLNDIGIYTFEQISQLDAELIQVITEAIEFFPGRIQRDDWVGQAKALFNRN
ncbi:MAG: hypothetical protein AAGD05_08390 [Bacteroidota bacterium]